MLEDVEDEGRDEHLATGGGSSQHATSSTMPKPRFHILAGFLGRSRQKKSAGNDTYSVPWRGGGVPWSGVEGSAVAERSGISTSAPTTGKAQRRQRKSEALTARRPEFLGQQAQP